MERLSLDLSRSCILRCHELLTLRNRLKLRLLAETLRILRNCLNRNLILRRIYYLLDRLLTLLLKLSWISIWLNRNLR